MIPQVKLAREMERDERAHLNNITFPFGRGPSIHLPPLNYGHLCRKYANFLKLVLTEELTAGSSPLSRRRPSVFHPVKNTKDSGVGGGSVMTVARPALPKQFNIGCHLSSSELTCGQSFMPHLTRPTL